MPASQLPPELLDEIFSNLSSSSSDLYSSLLACKTFCEIVKPILYQHITITTRQRRYRLLNVKEEDKQLVKKLTISDPNGNLSSLVLESHFECKDCPLGKNLVIDLLTGKLLDITTINILHIRNIHEDPSGVVDPESSSSELRPALKLTELSINSHQGGGDIWEIYLESETPALRRLAYVGVTLYWRQISGSSLDNVWESPSRLPARIPYTQLQVLAAAPHEDYRAISDFPLDNFLAILEIGKLYEEDLSLPFPNCYILLQNVDDSDYHLFKSFHALVQEIVSRPENRGARLFLPSYHARLRGEDHGEEIEAIKSHDVRVIIDEEIVDDRSTLLIVPSFVKYLEENGKLRRD